MQHFATHIASEFQQGGFQLTLGDWSVVVLHGKGVNADDGEFAEEEGLISLSTNLAEVMVIYNPRNLNLTGMFLDEHQNVQSQGFASAELVGRIIQRVQSTKIVHESDRKMVVSVSPDRPAVNVHFSERS